MDALLSRLRSGAELGVPYVDDELGLDARSAAPLLVTTQLADPAHCGRRRRGWSVKAGVRDPYTFATLRDLPMLGNRSQFAQFSFCSTQTGVPDGEHGLIEMRLCRGTTADDIPVRIRIENGAFYIVTLNTELVLAGARETRQFTMSADAVYTLSVLMFQKAVFARLRGPGLLNGALEIVVPDRRRFIPGRPGFGLRPNPQASGGDLTIFDWIVTPVGPANNCQLGAIGDSITAGVDQEPEVESYVHLATQALGQELVLNTGSGGADTALNLARFRYEIAPFRPRITWIESGGADITQGLSAESTFGNMMGQVRQVTWGGHAVLSTVSPLVLSTPSRYEERLRLNRMIRESGLPFVDRDAVVRDPADKHHLRGDLSHADRIHLNRSAHGLVADAAIRVFKTLSSP